MAWLGTGTRGAKQRNVQRDAMLLELARECLAQGALWPSRPMIALLHDADDTAIYRSVRRLRKEGRIVMATVKDGAQRRLKVERVA